MSLVQLKTELRQELKLTPQLMQSMEVLQMTSQELLEYLSRQAEENPLLDQSDPPERAYEELRRQAGWIDGGVRDRATFAHEEAAMEAGREDSRLESLAAFLRDQIHRLRLSKPLTALCQYLAELVDEDGYLAQEDLDGLASMRIPQALTDQALDALRAEHGAILAQVRAQEAVVEGLEREYSQVDGEFTQRKLEGINVLDALSFEQYLRALERKLQVEYYKLEELRRREERKRDQVVEARKETATIEKLKEHKLEDYRKAEQKDEEQRIEEFVSTTRAMAAMGM